MADLLSNGSRPMPPAPEVGTPERRFDKTEKLTMRTKTVKARSVTECLLLGKKELGPDAIIVSKKTFKEGALFGRWGGREMVEVTFGTYLPAAHPLGSSAPSAAPTSIVFHPVTPAPPEARDPRVQKLEAEIAGLTATIQTLKQPSNGTGKAAIGMETFQAAPFEARPANGNAPLAPDKAEAAPKPPRNARRPRSRPETEPAPEAEPYSLLTQQLLDSDVAAPLARQLISEVPAGLMAQDAATYLRTVISQRLRIANRLEAHAGKMQILAFIGTTGVGKTTTIAKLVAQYALIERRRVGVVTLDTYRVAAAQQLQTYGQILKTPVKVAHDKVEMMKHLEDFKADGIELVLLDTAGRSPNDMIPLGETAHLFDGLGAIQKYLALPATLGARDMENVISRFTHLLSPDALILTKLDESCDSACWGRLLTVQAKTGLPLAYVTTGQKVPDDITLPDAHAIAARILSSAAI